MTAKSPQRLSIMIFSHPIDDELDLRLIEPRHAEEIFAAVNANREHLRRWLPWVDLSKSAQDTREFAARTLRGFAEGKRVALSILVRGRVVGGIGLNGIQRHSGDYEAATADLGYWLTADVQGRGLTTRSARALLDHAFRELELHRVTIRCEPDNHRSRGVPQRLGFQFEGVLRHVCRYDGRWVDHRLYAMLAEDWQSCRTTTSQQSTTEVAP